MNSKLKPALIGGGALGLLLVLTTLVSAIPVPFVSLAGCCNCLWPVLFGILTTKLYVGNSTNPASVGDGAVLGGLTGIVGGIIYLVISLPITFFLIGVEALEAQIRQINPTFPLSGGVLLVVGSLLVTVIFVILALIGGIIGVPIFEKRKPEMMQPPPPQNFGGPGYGTGV